MKFKKKDAFVKYVPSSGLQLSLFVCTADIGTPKLGQSTQALEALEDGLLAAVSFDLTVSDDYGKIYLHVLQLLFF